MKELEALPTGNPGAAAAETELVARALARSGEALRAIMQTHNRRLYRIARSITRHDGDAEDVLQEAYVRAFTRLESFRGESLLSTWLTRIVVNEALGRLRRNRREARLEEAVRREREQARIIPFPLAGASDNPEKTMAQRQLLRLVEQATDSLPDAFRTVFVARVIEGMSIEETAELFGLRPETVRTRLHRARHLVRRRIEEQVGPVLTDAFPFAGVRCARLTETVLRRLELSP